MYLTPLKTLPPKWTRGTYRGRRALRDLRAYPRPQLYRLA